jgi:subtilisin
MRYSFFPASHPDVIAVSAIDCDDKLYELSDYRKEVELTAPGVDMKSTIPDALGSIGRCEGGTSFSAPLVAAVAALVWSCNRELSNEDVRTILRDTAEDLGDPDRYGFGVVNAVEAVKRACHKE